MKNTFLNKIDSIISIKITGKNVYNFINKIIKNKINIYNLDIINKKEAIVKIKYKDYLKLKNASCPRYSEIFPSSSSILNN